MTYFCTAVAKPPRKVDSTLYINLFPLNPLLDNRRMDLGDEQRGDPRGTQKFQVCAGRHVAPSKAKIKRSYLASLISNVHSVPARPVHC